MSLRCRITAAEFRAFPVYKLNVGKLKWLRRL